jgi:DNA polymerase-3 subunit delta
MARSRSAAPPLTAAQRIVLLRGPDAYLRREHTRRLVEALEAEHGSIGQFAFDGAAVEPAVVLDELRSYGLLQEHKLVILDNADEFLVAPDNVPKGVRTARQLMEQYAEAPVDSATLLLRANTWRPGKLDKAIEKGGGAIIKCDAPSAREAVGFCTGRCSKRYDCTIEPAAAQLLVDRTGCELARLDQELGRLAAFVGSGGTITTETIRDQVGLSREEKAWVVQEALLSGSAAEAVGKVRELLQISRQPEQLVLWAITDLLRKLHAASRLMAQGLDGGSIAKRLRLFGGGQRALLAAAGNVEARRWAQLLQVSIETDRRSKRGYGSTPRSIEALAVQIADTMGCA